MIQVPEADRVYAYITGVDLQRLPWRDEIWLFQNPNNRQGWISEYNLATPLRILPKPDTQCASCSGMACVSCRSWLGVIYNGGHVYRVGSDFYMVSGFSDPIPPIPNNQFFRVLLGRSTGGKNWQ